MFTGKNITTSERAPLTIVQNSHTKNIEREVDSYVKSIRVLIAKLTPTERQKYYNGLLAFILNEQIDMNSTANEKKIDESDFTKLSAHELGLLEELSMQMQKLYRTIGHDTES